MFQWHFCFLTCVIYIFIVSFFFGGGGPVFKPCCCLLEGSSHSSCSSEGQRGSLNLYVNVKRDGQNGGGVYFREFGGSRASSPSHVSVFSRLFGQLLSGEFLHICFFIASYPPFI